MNILVCVKRVPDTTEAEVVIAKDGRSIEEGDLVFDINEWDKYAVEEAVLLKEKFGCLTEDTKNIYKGWIREIHVEDEDKERYCSWFVEHNGRECTDADVERYENGLRAQKLYDVREVLPELNTAMNAVLEKYKLKLNVGRGGLDTAIEEAVYNVVMHGGGGLIEIYVYKDSANRPERLVLLSRDGGEWERSPSA